MSTTFTLRVTGLAICYIREPFWNVIFVCDDVHPLELTYPAGGGTASASLHESGRDLTVSFRTGQVSEAENPYAQNAGRLFNMAGESAHGPGTLRFLRRRKITDIVSMQVPTSILGVSETTDGYYYVQEQTFPGMPVKIIDPVAKDVQFTFRTEDKVVMSITDPKDPAYDREFIFDGEVSNVDLDFDNDCHNKCTHNDFLDLYEVVIDGDEKEERKFAAGQIKGNVPNANPRIISRLGGTMSPEQGNCDPVEIRPAPSNGP